MAILDMADGASIKRRFKSAIEFFISYDFAVIVIVILLLASLSGWIAQELLPVDFAERTSVYAREWHPVAFKAVMLLRLYDPFHSLWYRLILFLFCGLLLTCSFYRLSRRAIRSINVKPPSRSDDLQRRHYFYRSSWRSIFAGPRGERDPLLRLAERYGVPEHIDTGTLNRFFIALSKLFASRGYGVVSHRGEDFIAFAAYAGRFRNLGTMVFHLGIIIVALGGLVGSVWGWREVMYLGEGETCPIDRNSKLQLYLSEFSIVLTPTNELRDYISHVKVVGERGDTLASAAIEVNKPMKFGGINIYQSSFMLAGGGYSRALLSYVEPAGQGRRKSIELSPGKRMELDSMGASIVGLRFVPDFRIGRKGAFSATELPLNPALLVEIEDHTTREKGWLFLRHPEFNEHFGILPGLELTDVEIEYLSGLEIASNPGADTIFAGFGLATLGLILMYSSNRRVIKGFVTREGLEIAGMEYQWRTSFGKEFEDLRSGIVSIFGTGDLYR